MAIKKKETKEITVFSSPQRELWVGAVKQSPAANAGDIMLATSAVRPKICRSAGARFGLLISDPQLALWATDMPSASPTRGL